MESEADICRVCRCEATAEKPLFHPCICTGSIKYIHQDCLVQWLKYTRKSYCELCRHQFKFRPIYRPDTPSIVPFRDIFYGIARSVARCFQTWLHCYLVAFVWLGVVPLTSCRIYNFFLSKGSSALSSMYNLFRMENFLSDVVEGCVIVTAVLLLFIALVWLKDQVQSNAPDWLQRMDWQAVPNRGEANAVEVNNGEDDDDEDDDGEDEDDIADVDGDEPDVQNENILNNNADHVDQPQPQQPAPAEVINNNGDNNNNNNQGVWILGGGDEMTWDRVLGLDGSFVFLEHALWIITLNLMFILFFAFLPSHVGYHVTVLLGMSSMFTQSQFQRPVETFWGYMCISAMLCAFYTILCPLLRVRRQSARVVGQMYLISKVLLLIVIEICVFPIACGWWLDILTFSLFGASLNDRVDAFTQSPWTSTLVHWTVGMIFVFYLASSFMLLRELLRPGVLWFLRNINDPEFNPIVEMIQFPVYRHVRRIAMSIVMFGCLSILIIYWPVRMASFIMPTVLPYRFPSTLPTSFPLHLMSQLFLLNLVLPALLDPGHTRQWVKVMLQLWLRSIGSKLLGLESYLFGSRVNENGVNSRNAENANHNNHHNQDDNGNNNNNNNGQLAEMHQQMIDVQMRRDEADNEPFVKPPLFYVRVCALLLMGGVSLFIGGLAMFAVPVSLGRLFLRQVAGVEPDNVHDLYSVAIGLFTLYAAGRLAELIGKYVQISMDDFSSRVRVIVTWIVKVGAMASLILGLLPLLLGAVIDCYLLSALRAPLWSTPVGESVHLWATGFVQVKLLAALVVLGPRNRVREAIEALAGIGPPNNGNAPQAQNNEGFNFKTVLLEVVLPALIGVGFVLSAPYVVMHTLVPLLRLRIEVEAVVQRCIHFAIVLVSVCALLVGVQARQMRQLYIRIKNDKYMIGHQLMNYNTSTRQYINND